MGVEGKTDMSGDYENFHEIPPFKVKADPSTLLNDEEYPCYGAIRKGHKRRKSEDLLMLNDEDYPCFCRNPLNFLAHAMLVK